MEARIATEHDVDGITATLAAAFAADPLWSWAFPEEGLAELWRLFVSSALRYPWVWVADDNAAASVWIPPGGIELTEAEEASLAPMLEEFAGPRAAEIEALLGRLADNHPDQPPHYYLSLLGTHPDHRGKGLGMSLLAENLAMIDSEAMPAYLESSNPQNDPRYERLGFVQVGEFHRPDGQLTCATMWREPR